MQHRQLHFSHKHYRDLTRDELYELMWLREEVFVVGQKVTAECEVDGLDPQCVHIIGRPLDGSRPLATARLFMDHDPVKVGRVAVHPQLQRLGLGTQLMRYVHEVMQNRPGTMSAQAHLEPWYTALGWQAQGEVYIEADIPHIHMIRGV